MHEKELCSVTYNEATVFLMNDFPSMCECMARVQTCEKFRRTAIPGKTRYVCNYLSKIN